MTRKAQALAVALLVAAIAPAAAAQTAGSGNSPADQSFVSKATPGDWRISKLVGVAIYGPNDESIGKVNDVVIDGSGAIKAVVVGVGGFLGVGQKNVGLPFSLIKWSDAPLPAKVPITPAPITGVAPKTPATGAAAPMQPTPMAVPAPRSASIYDYPDHGSVTLTKDQLKSAPDFHYASETKSVGG